VKTRRVGGANLPVPVEVNPFRGSRLRIRWLLQYSRERAARRWWKLADELIDAAMRAAGDEEEEECTAWRKRTKAFRIIDVRNGGFCE